MADQEVQEVEQIDEETELPDWMYKLDSSVFPIFLFMMIALSIAVGIGFSWWNENSIPDTSVSKSRGFMALTEDFFQWFRS